jgi:hypothetical protein
MLETQNQPRSLTTKPKSTSNLVIQSLYGAPYEPQYHQIFIHNSVILRLIVILSNKGAVKDTNIINYTNKIFQINKVILVLSLTTSYFSKVLHIRKYNRAG